MRILVFFQHNPYPPTTGAHQRCLAVLRALKALDHEVTLFSSNMHTDTIWEQNAKHAFEQEYEIRTRVYKATQADLRYCARINWNEIQRSQWGHFASPGLRRAFMRYAQSFRPDVVIVNYTFFGDLIDNDIFRNSFTIMETLDMYSLSLQMQKCIYEHLPTHPVHPGDTPKFLLDDDFLSGFRLDPWPEEYRMCDLYNASIVVSPSETRSIKLHTNKTQVDMIPITAEPVDPGNTYKKSPLFLAALNMLNVQGYLYFACRVLPLLQTALPDFSLDVVGSCCKHVQPVKGMIHRGYVPSMSDLYRECAFAICPLLGATGQQIKVVEAMSFGIPVVVHQNVADSSPVIHGINGFVARNADQFADYCHRLYTNRELCRQMGSAARNTIKENWSQEVLTSRLANLLARKCSKKSYKHAMIAPAPQPQSSSCTVIVDAFKCNATSLGITLESIAKQTSQPHEVIICGKESGDLKSIIKENGLNVPFRIIAVISPDNALHRTTGSHLAILCSGDIIFEDTIKNIEAAFKKHPGISWLQCRPAFCNEKGKLTWIMEDPPGSETLPGLWNRRSAMFWRTDLWKLTKKAQRNQVSSWFVNHLEHLAERGYRPASIEILSGATCHASTTSAESNAASIIPSKGPLLMAGAKSLKFLQNQMRALNRYDFISSMDKLDSVYSDKSKGQKPLLQAFLQRMVQCRWESWATFEGRTARVALFGAGVHTYWFLSVVRNSKGPHVVAILDDFARIGAKVFGIPVIRAAGFDPSQVDAIIPCTDSNQAKFTQRCKELYGNRIPVWKLYEGLPAGPYQKEFTNAPRRHK